MTDYSYLTDVAFLTELGDRLIGEQLISIEIYKRLMKIVEALNGAKKK